MGHFVPLFPILQGRRFQRFRESGIAFQGHVFCLYGRNELTTSNSSSLPALAPSLSSPGSSFDPFTRLASPRLRRRPQLARHEHYLAAQIGLKKGMKVLDVGCGVGGPARQIANFTDARITGINNNDFQLARARKYTEKAGLSHLVDFKKGDFMKLSEQFGENSFDAGEYRVRSVQDGEDGRGS